MKIIFWCNVFLRNNWRYIGFWRLPYSKRRQKIVPCTQHSIFWGLAGSHLHVDSSKNTGFLEPVYPRPLFVAAACGGAENGDGPAVVTTFQPYQRLCGDV